RMEIRADPGVPTTIEVFDPTSDAQATTVAQPPYVPLPPNWDFQLPDPLGDTSWGVDIDSRKALGGGGMASSQADLIWESGYGLYSFRPLGFAPASIPTPEQCRDSARSNATGKVPAEDLRNGQTFCVESDRGNVAWIRITRVSRRHADPERAELSLTAV